MFVVEITIYPGVGSESLEHLGKPCSSSSSNKIFDGSIINVQHVFGNNDVAFIGERKLLIHFFLPASEVNECVGEKL